MKEDTDCIVWTTCKVLDEWGNSLNTRNRSDLYRIWYVQKEQEAGGVKD